MLSSPNKEVPGEVPGGFCRICRSGSRCIDSRAQAGYVRRRRECLNPGCGRRWSTREVEIDDEGLMTGKVVVVTLKISATGPVDVRLAETHEQNA